MSRAKSTGRAAAGGISAADACNATPKSRALKLAATGRKRLAELRRQEIDPGIAADALVRIGKPYAEIIHTANEWDIDLIIIATHGYEGLKHVFLGSTAERVVRHAPCPVLVVRQQEHELV